MDTNQVTFDTVSLSASRFYVASSCSQKYDYQYKQGLRKKGGDTYRMELGRVVHDLIAEAWRVQVREGNVYAIGQDYNPVPPAKMVYKLLGEAYFEENKDKYAPTGDYVIMLQGVEPDLEAGKPLEEFQDMVNDATRIVEHLFETYLLKTYVPVVIGRDMNSAIIEKELKDNGLLSDFVEDATKRNYVFHGFVDFVGYNKETGTVDLVDWKTRKSLQDTGSNNLNPQLDFYAYFLNRLFNVTVDRVVEYQVRSKAPEMPKINKNGTVSKAKCTTTVAMYTEAILMAGGKLEDYQEQLDTWVGSDWVAPLIKPTNVGVQLRHICNAIGAIDNAQRHTFRSTGWQCQQCPFYNLCEAHILGYNEDTVIEELYERKWEVVESALDTD